VPRFAKILSAILLVIIGLFSGLLFVIYVLNQRVAPPVDEFPDGCRWASNCVRLVFNMSVNQSDFQHNFSIPTYNASIATLQNSITDWLHLIENEDAIVASNSTFIHAIFVSVLWSFADDFYTLITAINNGTNAIQLQSNSRLGKSDLGVNPARVQRFIAWMDSKFKR